MFVGFEKRWLDDAAGDGIRPDLCQKLRAHVCWHTISCLRKRVSLRCFVDQCRTLMSCSDNSLQLRCRCRLLTPKYLNISRSQSRIEPTRAHRTHRSTAPPSADDRTQFDAHASRAVDQRLHAFEFYRLAHSRDKFARPGSASQGGANESEFGSFVQ